MSVPAGRYPQPLVPKPVKVAAVAVLAAVALAWLLWAAAFHSEPPVSAQVAGYTVRSDREVAVTVTVDRPDPSIPVACIVIAQAENFEEVGRITIEPGATEAGLIDVKEVIKTFRRATSASVKSCSVQ